MRLRRWCVLFLLVGLGLPAPSAAQGVEEYWQRAKASLKEGAYRDALDSLNAILKIAPDDPWAELYRALCEQRLDAPRRVPRMTAEQLNALTERLQQEEEAQARQADQQKAVQRAIQQEQAAWDQQLEQVAQPPPAPSPPPPPAPTPEPIPAPASPLEIPGPAVPAPQPPEPVKEAPDVELPPVVVPTLPPRPRAAPPAGAVAIYGRQMRMLQERNLAIAEGDVEVLYGQTRLTCDRLTLFTDTHDAYAEGRVRIEEGGQLFRADLAHYNFDTKKGRFLQGTLSSPPWFEYGRWSEHLAEGVSRVRPGYLTSCDHEPPHFRFHGAQATVFEDEGSAREHNVILFADRLPVLYLPRMSLGELESPFYHIPGKKKPWGHYLLSGYRFDFADPLLGDDVHHEGTVKMDWRRHFGWGGGVDDRIESERLGKALFKFYYNDLKNRREQKESLPKGVDRKRYRALWRHTWEPLEDTTVLTNIEKYGDQNFRKDLLFMEEFVDEDNFESYISSVTNTPVYSLTVLLRKRMNRFQSVTEAFPDLQVNVRDQQVGDTHLFSQSTFGFANLQSRTAHSEDDTDVVRLDWFQKFSYALNWFRPIEITPNFGVRQTYYTKDSQGGAERPQGKRDVLSGQASSGVSASLTLFRIFPVVTNALGLNIRVLRHVLTPTLEYSYVRRPTVPNDLLSFPSAGSSMNKLTFGIKNKLQTKRTVKAERAKEGLTQEEGNQAESGQSVGRSVDLARFLIEVPYTFRGHQTKQGGELGDWSFDLELFPWPWLRVESNWSYPSHFVKGSRDRRLTSWNIDVVMVGGRGEPLAEEAPDIQAPKHLAVTPEPEGGIKFTLPDDTWYLGMRHNFSHDTKSDTVLQFDWRPNEKWEVGTLHRVIWKEVAGSSKRFNNVREYQYRLRRDLHDWMAELVYRVDREFGEELFLTLTLKAFTDMPIELSETYHEPKRGSQSSPFSPVPQR